MMLRQKIISPKLQGEYCLSYALYINGHEMIAIYESSNTIGSFGYGWSYTRQISMDEWRIHHGTVLFDTIESAIDDAEAQYLSGSVHEDYMTVDTLW